MASSTLDPDNMPERDRRLGSGHGTRALGPSDTSDSGSDVQDSMRWTNEADLGLDRGTLEDSDSERADRTAGPDIGDAWLDSDTDARGTGEVATAGRDPAVEMGGDIGTDHIESIAGEDEMAASDEDADEGVPSLSREDRERAQQRPSRH
ncbi:MAG TPA: hypothetical protein VM406_07325 [Noviherbaspirillum sp.]|nr:hypothetical protein [Noviherbaspirillum sp.]